MSRPEAWPAPVPHGKTFQQFAMPPGGPRTSGMAIASLVCGILGFLCGVPALFSIGLGLGALVSIAGAPHARRGRGLAIAGIALSVFWLGSLVAVAVYSHARRDAMIRGLEAPQPVPQPVPVTPLPAPLPIPIQPGGAIPLRPGGAQGALVPAGGPLAEQLRAQVAGAEAGGRRLVVFFTATWCAPCQAVKQTLAAPDLAARLSAVQLVEVDVDAFPDPDISRAAAAHLDRNVTAIPLLCTLRSGRPPACMDGGAWGEDTDANIRAVLVPFLEAPPSGLVPGPASPVPI